MYLRKLFREPGPPRPRPWPPLQQDPTPLPSNLAWPCLPPTSSSPSPPSRVSEGQVRFSSSPQNAHQQTEHGDNLVDSHRRGHTVLQKQRADYTMNLEDECSTDCRNERTLITNKAYRLSTLRDMNVPALPVKDKDSRTVWRRKKKRKTLERKVGGDNRKNTIPSAQMWSPMREGEKSHHQSRNVVQRATQVLRLAALRPRRRRSAEWSLAVETRQDRAPWHTERHVGAEANRISSNDRCDGYNLQSGGNELTRRPDDGIVDGKWSGTAVQDRQDKTKFQEVCLAASRSPLQEIPQGVVYPSHPQNNMGADNGATPVKDWNSLDSQKFAPLLPVRLQPAPLWLKETPKNCQGDTHGRSQVCQGALVVANPEHSQVERRRLPRIPPTLLSKERPTDQQKEWHQVRRKAVTKVEDWVVRSKQAETTREEISDMGTDNQAHADFYDSTLDTKALHDRLASLLTDDDMRLAKGENRPRAISSAEKVAVVRSRVDTRVKCSLDELFSAGPVAHHRDEAINRRGFAEKMFSDAPAGKSEKHRGQDFSRQCAAMPPSASELSILQAQFPPHHVAASHLPHPRPAFLANVKGAFEVNDHTAVPSQHDLLLVSPNLPADPRHYRRESFGPSTDLADTIKPEVVGERTESTRKDVVYLGVPSLHSDDQDSRILSYAESQRDVFDRVQNWRIQTRPTPHKKSYAASASATEPSEFHRGAGKVNAKDDTGSRLTSISRRAQASEQRPNGKDDARGKEKAKETDISTTLSTRQHMPENGTHQGKKGSQGRRHDGVNQGEAPLRTIGRVHATMDIADTASTPFTSRESEGTRHIRHLSEEESRRIFQSINTPIKAEARVVVPPILSGQKHITSQVQEKPTAQLERQVPTSEVLNGASQWEKLIKNLAGETSKSETDNIVEALLTQYSEETKTFYSQYPDLLLLASLRAKVAKADISVSNSVETGRSIDGRRAHNVEKLPEGPSKGAIMSRDFLKSFSGDEKQVERALHKIVDYVENAGEIAHLQKSLLELHQSLLDRSHDPATIDRRLTVVSHYSDRDGGLV
ncbi:hypothetical protein CBS101457_000854 [Exobasidium rhododendri]|nr:hypothetical protein CBS101457_000854 [Exobasidium rhododendri]